MTFASSWTVDFSSSDTRIFPMRLTWFTSPRNDATTSPPGVTSTSIASVGTPLTLAFGSASVAITVPQVLGQVPGSCFCDRRAAREEAGDPVGELPDRSLQPRVEAVEVAAGSHRRAHVQLA